MSEPIQQNSPQRLREPGLRGRAVRFPPQGTGMKNHEEVTPTEARQATLRPRAMVWVLFGSLFLCLMAGLGLALGWISLPFLATVQ